MLMVLVVVVLLLLLQLTRLCILRQLLLRKLREGSSAHQSRASLHDAGRRSSSIVCAVSGEQRFRRHVSHSN